MFITAHTVVITWNAGHVLFHAVRLSRAVFVAAILKTDNKSGSLYLRFSLTHTNPLYPHSKKRALFILAEQWTERQSECRETRSHMATVRHTALLVKALSAGQAMPGVICRKQTKKLSSPFKQELWGKNSWTRSATHWEESSVYCRQRSFRLPSRDLHRTHFLQPSSQAMQSL